MLGRLNIRRPAESVYQTLSDCGIFGARLIRPRRDRSILSTDCHRLNRRPKGSVFSTGHRFPDLARDDLGLSADYYLQDIATWTNNASRAQCPGRWLVDQGIVHHFEAQARRAGVYEVKIPVTT
jgi:hypothetical protein